MNDIQIGKRHKRWEMDPSFDNYDDGDDIEIQHIPRSKPKGDPSSVNEEMTDVPVSDFDVFANPKKMYTEEDEYPVGGFDSDDDAPPPGGDKDDSDEGGLDESSDEEDNVSGGPARDDPNRPSEGYKSILDEKVDLLSRIYSYQAKGMTVRTLDTNSSIQEIRFEHHRLKREAQLKSSNKFCQSALMTCVNGLEMINARYNPWKLRLDGFSQHTYENIDEYDNVFEKLHDKYSSYVDIGPEYELVMLLGANAFIFHMSNTLTQSANLGKAMEKNPDLMRSVFKTMGDIQRMDNQDGQGGGASRPPDPPVSTRGAPFSRPSSDPPARNGPPSREMSGPQIDLSGFQLPTGLMGSVSPSVNPTVRPTVLPEDVNPPEPPIETRPPRIEEDELGELDSLAGSDQDEAPAPLPEPEITPAPKKRGRGRPRKSKVPAENTIEI